MRCRLLDRRQMARTSCCRRSRFWTLSPGTAPDRTSPVPSNSLRCCVGWNRNDWNESSEFSLEAFQKLETFKLKFQRLKDLETLLTWIHRLLWGLPFGSSDLSTRTDSQPLGTACSEQETFFATLSGSRPVTAILWCSRSLLPEMIGVKISEWSWKYEKFSMKTFHWKAL